MISTSLATFRLFSASSRVLSMILMATCNVRVCEGYHNTVHIHIHVHVHVVYFVHIHVHVHIHGVSCTPCKFVCSAVVEEEKQEGRQAGRQDYI